MANPTIAIRPTAALANAVGTDAGLDVDDDADCFAERVPVIVVREEFWLCASSVDDDALDVGVDGAKGGDEVDGVGAMVSIVLEIVRRNTVFRRRVMNRGKRL